MSEGEEGVSAGRRKREYEMAGERERERSGIVLQTEFL